MGTRRSACVITAAALSICLSLGACGSGEEASQAATQQITKYRAFLEENAELVVVWTAKMRGQIAADDVSRAESRYATARVQFGQIEPIARTMDGLYERINAHHDEAEPGELTGYHGVEKGLFKEESTNGLKPMAKQLLADVEELQRKLKATPLQPKRLAVDAAAMMKEVATVRMAGQEEPFSHLDLVDISANVEGAQEAFDAAKPALDNEELAARIDAQFETVYAALKLWGLSAREPQTRPAAAGARFSLFTELTPAERRALAQPIARLEALLARVPGQLEIAE